MISTVTLDSESIKSLDNLESRVKNPSDLQTYAAKLNLVANVVEDNWTKLPVSSQNALKIYVYHLMDRRPSIWERIRGLLFMWRVLSSKEELSVFLNAVVRLENVVLDQIERENHSYKERLDSAFNEIERSDFRSVGATADELSDWLRTL